MRRLILLQLQFATMLCAAISLSACHNTQTHKHSSAPPLTVQSAVAYAAPLRDDIWFATSTRAQNTVTIEPRVSGSLGAIHFSGGDIVKQGERLFTIDPSQIYTEFYSAEAGVESAEAQLVEAKNNYDRAIPLSRIEAISQSTLDQYRATYIAAKSTLKSAKQQLQSAKLNLSYTYIDAPIDGVVAESPADLGDYVGVGTQFSTLTTISSTDTLLVDLTIPMARYLRYLPQSGAIDNSKLLSQITLILPDSSNYAHLATYDYTKRDEASGSSTVVIVARVPNPDGVLKPNMFARLHAQIGDLTDRILIPQSAVIAIQGVNFVYVIKPDSTATYRRVTLGATHGDEWQITSGVAAGERIATSAQLKLHEGAKVKLQSTNIVKK